MKRNAVFTMYVGMFLLSSVPVEAADKSAQPVIQKQSKKVVSAKKNGTKKVTKALTEKDALTLIEKLPEVQKFKHSVDAAEGNSKPVVELDRKEGNEYVVHVYEDVPDDAETSHTATFNWYYVNIKTGKIRKDF